MRNRIVSLLFGLAMLAPEPLSAESALQKRLVSRLKYAMTQGNALHKFGPALKLLAPAFTVTFGRSETPDAHDIRQSIGQVRRKWKLFSVVKPKPVTLVYTLLRFKRANNRIVVHLRARYSGKTAIGKSDYRFVERYTLVRLSGAWRILALRYWPHSFLNLKGQQVLTNAAYWVEQDKKLARYRATGKHGNELLFLLIGAMRYHEAAKQLEFRLRRDPNDPMLLSTQGYVLWKLGRISPALESYRKAKRLRPKLKIPSFVPRTP